jgi:putative glutamine amidotransferase
MAADRPLVALTTSTEPEAGDHRQSAVFLYTSYIAALENAGVTPLLLTPPHSAASIAALLDVASGLVLSGGEDIDPAHYGERPRVELEDVHPERDAMELYAVQRALDLGIPVLGVCRGHQLLNVAFGGTLHQDIPTDRPGSLGHTQSGGWERRAHDVFVEPDSLLYRIIGERTLRINSFHHQAIRDVAPGLRVVGRAEDGLVEAIESESHPWVLGIQWHPERLEAAASDREPDRRVFAAFAAAARDTMVRP